MTVILLPVLVVNDVGMGDPFFCKYICPQGVLEGAIPLSAIDEGIRSALGNKFIQKAYYFDYCSCTECGFLSSVLQVDLSTRCFLCIDEQGVVAWNKG